MQRPVDSLECLRVDTGELLIAKKDKIEDLELQETSKGRTKVNISKILSWLFSWGNVLECELEELVKWFYAKIKNKDQQNDLIRLGN